MTLRLAEDQHRRGGLVQLAIAITVLPSWRGVGLVALSTLLLVPFNLFVSRKLVPRFGPSVAMAARTLVNFAVCAVFYHLLGWPPASFLWLPYAALASDGSRREVSYGVIAFNAIAYSTVSVADGVAWQVPFVWTVIAVFCRHITDKRVAIVGELLQQSERQRSELADEIAVREWMEVELRQSQKLDAVGRLAAGVAHEINNPLQFVGDSALCVAEGIDDLAQKSDRWRRKLDEVELPPHVRAALDREEQALHLPELRADVIDSIRMLQDGVARVTTIVSAMKDFADPEVAEKALVDLNRAIEATLVVSRHEYARIADVRTELASLPGVECQSGAIAQVLLSLVVNAAHAIADRSDRPGRGAITVRSKSDDSWVHVSVTDDGVGIPREARERIFEPFFTTRPVGKGAGQGLAVARSIIERHGGRIGFETESGLGTTFTFRLPVSAPS